MVSFQFLIGSLVTDLLEADVDIIGHVSIPYR